MTSQHSTETVLIVGAGPTGLALAGNLAKLGVKVRLIDKALERSDKSRALVIQAGTLEMIEHIYGEQVVKKFLMAGIQVNNAFLYIEKKDAIHINLNQIPSKYNYAFVLVQGETERILEEELHAHGVKIERGAELVSLTNHPSQVSCELKLIDGSIEKIDVAYVAGCDGAHSVVRKSMDLPFEGNIYNGDFILGDVTLDWPFEHGAVRSFLSGKGVMACFPMGENKKYRVIMIPHGDKPDASMDVNLAEFQKIADSLAPVSIQISEPLWLTRFNIHHRITPHLRKNRLFIAGDAAHIHSPIGGQGMNTGIQDAFNLAQKLHRVLSKQAQDDLLDQYEAQRLPVAFGVVKGTDAAFQFFLRKDSWVTKIIRNVILPFVIKKPFAQKIILTAMSEIKVARRELVRRIHGD